MNIERAGLLTGKNILVMGLLDTNSLAFAIGQQAEEQGAKVTYTVQNERFKNSLLRRSFKQSGLNVDDFSILFCDVTSDEDATKLATEVKAPLDGFVYSVAYANPKTCLQKTLFGAPRADILQALDISAVGFAKVTEALKEKFIAGSSALAMTFDSSETYPNYSWMGVAKSALESISMRLARDLGSSGIRVNCLSAGPQHTTAADNIPGFARIEEVWPKRAPLGWDLNVDRKAVADSAIYLLSDLSRKVTGTIHTVDGGFHSVAITDPSETK